MCGSPFPREVVALAIVEVHLCLLSPKAEDCRLVDSAEAVVALAFFECHIDPGVGRNRAYDAPSGLVLRRIQRVQLPERVFASA